VFKIGITNLRWVRTLLEGRPDDLGDIDGDIEIYETQVRNKEHVYVGAGHFTLDSLYFAGGTASSTPRLTFVRGASPEPRPHLLAATVLKDLRQHVTGVKAPPRKRSAASLKGPLVTLCPCSDTVDPCTDFLLNNDMKVHPPRDVTSEWYKHIIQGGGGYARRAAAASEKRPVHINHFRKEDLVQKTVQHGRKQYRPKDGVLPKLERQLKHEAPSPPPPPVTKMHSARILNIVRQYGQGGVSDATMIEEVAEAADIIASQSTAMEEKIRAATEAAVAASDIAAQAAADAVVTKFGRSGKTIWELIQDPDKCFYYTNHEDFEILEATWDYMDADGAFSAMTLRKPGRSDPEGANKSRKPNQGFALTPFGQFCFFEVTFKHFRGEGLLQHAAHMFGIHLSTAHRYYESWVLATGRFFDGQQHPATLSQAFAATPASTRQNLCLGPKEVVFLGDCTERWTNDPQDGALHSVLYSSYKSHTTIKYLTVSTGDSYLSHVPRPFSGACTDNGAHSLAGIHHLFCVPCA
jgi:hypothetical protein